MKKKSNNKNSAESMFTIPMKVNTNEFKKFQLFLNEKANQLSEKQKLEIELFALQVKIEDYLNSNGNTDKIITVGDFIRLYLEKLNIKQNKLAEYIGQEPSNFNKILSGNRPVNFELSFILSRIFNLDPRIWILIQIQNKFLQLNKAKQRNLKKYKIEDLIRI